MIKYVFLSDLVIDLAEAKGATPAAPSAPVLREIAVALDHVILLPDALGEYLEQLDALLRPLHGKHGIDQKTRKPIGIDNLPYLRPLDEATVDDMASSPLGTRSDDWLRSHRVDLLALNSPALELLQDQVMEELPPDWERLLDDVSWLRRFNLPTPADGAAVWNESSPEVEKSRERELIRSRGEAQPSPHAPRRRVVLTVTLADLLEADVEHRENIAVQEASFEVEYSGVLMRVWSRGFAFAESGCTLSLRWLKNDRATVNGDRARAEAEVRGPQTAPIELHGADDYAAGQYLQFTFARTGHRPYAVRGVLKLKQA